MANKQTELEAYLLSIGFYSRIPGFYAYNTIDIDCRDPQSINITMEDTNLLIGANEEEVKNKIRGIVNDMFYMSKRQKRDNPRKSFLRKLF